MSDEAPEPTPEQTAAADELYAAGLEGVNAEHAWARSLARIDQAVAAASKAGIPAKGVLPLLKVPGSTAEKVRPMIRRHYKVSRT